MYEWRWSARRKGGLWNFESSWVDGDLSQSHCQCLLITIQWVGGGIHSQLVNSLRHLPRGVQQHGDDDDGMAKGNEWMVRLAQTGSEYIAVVHCYLVGLFVPIVVVLGLLWNWSSGFRVRNRVKTDIEIDPGIVQFTLFLPNHPHFHTTMPCKLTFFRTGECESDRRMIDYSRRLSLGRWSYLPAPANRLGFKRRCLSPPLYLQMRFSVLYEYYPIVIYIGNSMLAVLGTDVTTQERTGQLLRRQIFVPK